MRWPFKRKTLLPLYFGAYAYPRLDPVPSPNPNALVWPLHEEWMRSWVACVSGSSNFFMVPDQRKPDNLVELWFY